MSHDSTSSIALTVITPLRPLLSLQLHLYGPMQYGGLQSCFLRLVSGDIGRSR